MKYLIAALLVLSSLAGHAKTKKANTAKPTDNKEVVVDFATVDNNKGPEEQIFTSVEQMPVFPGGDRAMMEFLAQNIKYPTTAQEHNIQGKVVLQFVVTKTGEIGEVKIVKPVDPELDAEALRVVKLLPKFIPGKSEGKDVAVWYTLPVYFKLSDDDLFDPEWEKLTAEQMTGLYIGYYTASSLVMRAEDTDSTMIEKRLNAHLRDYNGTATYALAYQLVHPVVLVAYDMKNQGNELDTKALTTEFLNVLTQTNENASEELLANLEEDMQKAFASENESAIGKALGRYLAHSIAGPELSLDDKATFMGVMDYTLTKCDLSNVNEVAAIEAAKTIMNLNIQAGVDIAPLKEYCIKALTANRFLSDEQLKQLSDAIDNKIQQAGE